MRYLKRIYSFLILILKKLVLMNNVDLSAPLLKYNIAPDTKIKADKGSKIILGVCSTLEKVHLISNGGTLIIGNGCGINRNVIIVSRVRITIGDGTLIGPNVCIYDHDHAFGPKGLIKDEMKYGSIDIGNNVWIGAGVIILRGTSIGDNCIIGAGTIVTGKIPAYSLVTAENRNLNICQLSDRN